MNGPGETLDVAQAFIARCGRSNLADGGCNGGFRVELYGLGEPLEKKPIARKRIVVKVK